MGSGSRAALAIHQRLALSFAYVLNVNKFLLSVQGIQTTAKRLDG
jgi:hypothetical protein